MAAEKLYHYAWHELADKILEESKPIFAGADQAARASRARLLTALLDRSAKAEKSFRNLPQLEMIFLKNLNPLDVLNHQYLLIENPAKAVEFLESRG